MNEKTAAAALARVAAGLGVSESIFRGATPDEGVATEMAAALEASELLSIFSKIKDSQARKACLAFVRELESQST